MVEVIWVLPNTVHVAFKILADFKYTVDALWLQRITSLAARI